ncbi:transposable element Tcb2 transposase [Trichonephila clavipes]|nr:transposable element Tcb2 transposase [Trichonephila clavipes]
MADYRHVGEKSSIPVSKLHSGRQVLWFTVARRLYKGWIFVRRPERCLPVKVVHRRPLLEWHESRFRASRESQRQLILREVGTWFHRSNITERDRYGGPGVFVWGGVIIFTEVL